MPRRRSRSRRYWLLAGVAALLYASIAGYTLLRLALPSTSAGITSLRRGQAVLLEDPAAASTQFSTASSAFADTFAALRSAPGWSKVLTPLPPFRWQVRLLKSTQALSEAGLTASGLAARYPHHDTLPTDLSTLVGQTGNEFLTWYSNEQAALDLLQTQLDTAERELNAVPPWIVFGQKQEIEELQNRLASARSWLRTARSLTDATQAAFGADDPSSAHTFLVLFQNDAELRPVGGFIGSYAVLTASGGRIRQFQFGKDIYKIDKELRNRARAAYPDDPPTVTAGYLAPEQISERHALHPLANLAAITDYWGFRDSTVGVGFLPDAGESAARFYELATGTPIDGIIFTDASVLVDLLTVTGPVTLPGVVPVTVGSDGIRLALTQEVEHRYWQLEENRAANEPKTVIADFAPVLAARLQATPHGYQRSLPLLRQAVARQSIQFWVRDAPLAAQLTGLTPIDQPPTRTVLPTAKRSRNWLKVVNSNLGGMKSSRNIHQETLVQRQLSENQVTYTVTVRRRHQGNGIWPDAPNQNYLEFYLPREAAVSTLPVPRYRSEPTMDRYLATFNVSETVHAVTQDMGPDWLRVGCWASTAVGEQTEFTIRYSLPAHLANDHFTFLPQAGSQNIVSLEGE